MVHYVGHTYLITKRTPKTLLCNKAGYGVAIAFFHANVQHKNAGENKIPTLDLGSVELVRLANSIPLFHKGNRYSSRLCYILMTY